jgi:hypothetical protein
MKNCESGKKSMKGMKGKMMKPYSKPMAGKAMMKRTTARRK